MYKRQAVSKEIAQLLNTHRWTSVPTFSEHPVVMAAVIANLEVLIEEKAVSYTHLDVYKRQECSSEGEYKVFPSDRTERGTTVILHITEEESEFLSEFKLRDILDKYCAFMPVEIYFTDESKKEESNCLLYTSRCV